MAEPFAFTWKSGAPGIPAKPEGEGECSARHHPICKVMEWRDRLKVEKGLCKAQIGAAEGLSKARMTQMFSLLKLPQEAQDYLAALHSPAAIKFFSIRRLIAIAKLPTARQGEEIAKLKASSLG